MREINVAPPGGMAAGMGAPASTLCHSCGVRLNLDGARACAILICRTCRKDPKKLTAARAENGRHMRAHTIYERQTNPWYPFPDFSTAWSAV